ncbi:MAG TPA: Gfo/Idh/MocA family oxidoreductase [Vicinamibacterales bacterium]|nr:Gfo/Idh/MocA family oxidoreductase [Vicinamibacterales bacterium]
MKVRWGVLGTARIATAKVIPAMQRGEWSAVTAIASRDGERAERASIELGIPTVYGSYEALLADRSVEAVYIPLPNHLHVPWSIRAAEAGKHVLCEKPLGLGEDDVRELIAARDRTGVKLQEAFMVRTHPQWVAARDLVRAGRLGELRGMVGTFSYVNRDPANIRNVADFGGGALFDIGCYFVMTSRFIFGEKPRRVVASIDRDPAFHVDRRTSMLLEYSSGTFVGTCGTQMAPQQRIEILGSRARLEIEIPFNAPPDRPCRLFVDEHGPVGGGAVETIEIATCDQYTIQGDRFSQAIRERTPVVYPLEESLGNMRVIDALFRSAARGEWVTVAE